MLLFQWSIVGIEGIAWACEIISRLKKVADQGLLPLVGMGVLKVNRSCHGGCDGEH